MTGFSEDTIVAIATPPGRGALAIVRLSGPRAIEIAQRRVDPWPQEPRCVLLSRVHDAAGERLDECVVVFYRAPASFTGEDVVEVTCHGGAVGPAAISAAMVAAGARPAEPGEFTRRAVLNGRIDLLQAEAVVDLIDAGTRAAQRVALSQLDGGLSRRITALREQILGLEALAAYDIDFPEEDDGPVAPDRIVAGASDLISSLDALLATAPAGEIVRTGAVVVIAGAPNVGKSSLFNALLGRRRAIVAEIPGTTRDALEAMTEADGWPIRLVDTAGLRESTDTVERLGIEVSREYLERADVVLACGDSVKAVRNALEAIGALTRAPAVGVHTKADLRAPDSREPNGVVQVSASTGAGLRELGAAIALVLESASGALELDAPLLTRERHRFALERARCELLDFQRAFGERAIPALVASVHLREATRALEELIGGVGIDDILDRVFSGFCVGK